MMHSGFSSTTPMGSLARELLETMGVFQTTHPRNHTLMECEYNKPELNNPYIMVEDTFKDLSNALITIQGNFKDPQDPIYTIVKPIVVDKEYSAETELITGKTIVQKDLSAIASGVSLLNVSSRFPKENKYFQSSESLTSKRTDNFKKPRVKEFSENPQTFDRYDPNQNTSLSQLIIDEQKDNPNKNYGPWSHGTRFVDKDQKTIQHYFK